MSKSPSKFEIGEEVIYVGFDRPDLRNTVMIITEKFHSREPLVHRITLEQSPLSSWYYRTNYHKPGAGWAHESDFRKVRFDEEGQGEQNEETKPVENTVKSH